MKCYYHSEIEAVGVCKNCGKALCHDSAIEKKSGLFCKEGGCADSHQDISQIKLPNYISLGGLHYPVQGWLKQMLGKLSSPKVIYPVLIAIVLAMIYLLVSL